MFSHSNSASLMDKNWWADIAIKPVATAVPTVSPSAAALPSDRSADSSSRPAKRRRIDYVGPQLLFNHGVSLVI